MTNRRGEGDDPAAANGLLQTLRAGGLDAPMLAPAEPRWAQLRFAAAPGTDLRDRFRGALIGGAIGDALGRANEGVWPSEARERQIRGYQPWHGWQGGPKGKITDDTQMTVWLAESLLAAARRATEAGTPDLRDHVLDPDDLAKRFTRERIRGMGQAVREFRDTIISLADGLALAPHMGLSRPWTPAATSPRSSSAPSRMSRRIPSWPMLLIPAKRSQRTPRCVGD